MYNCSRGVEPLISNCCDFSIKTEFRVCIALPPSVRVFGVVRIVFFFFQFFFYRRSRAGIEGCTSWILMNYFSVFCTSMKLKELWHVLYILSKIVESCYSIVFHFCRSGRDRLRLRNCTCSEQWKSKIAIVAFLVLFCFVNLLFIFSYAALRCQFKSTLVWIA